MTAATIVGAISGRSPDTVFRPHILRQLDGAGDTRITWTPGNTEDTANARRIFNDLKGRGYLAYRVDIEDSAVQGEVMREFDPQVHEIIMAPQMAGG